SFTKEAELVKEEKNNDEETWFVDWNPGFIFPELADGGDIGLETTPSARGEILDRNKMPLALDDTVREIGVVSEEIGDNAEESKKELARLSKMSGECSDAKLNANWVELDLFVPLATVLPTNTSLLDQLGAIDGGQGNESTGRV